MRSVVAPAPLAAAGYRRDVCEGRIDGRFEAKTRVGATGAEGGPVDPRHAPKRLVRTGAGRPASHIRQDFERLLEPSGARYCVNLAEFSV
jgi:hypothetical protein